ncbi:hypothetical protein V6N13_128844 [Hibiscus sabdariffa]
MIIENDVGYIWHDDEFHFLVAASFGKSGGLLTIRDKNKFKMESYIVKSNKEKSERLGQKNRSYGIKEFNEFIDTCNLVEVPLSKESCTLFNFISVDPAENTFRIKHVQSGCYVCSSRLDDNGHGLVSSYKTTDSQSADVFTIIDWSSLMILPRHVALKGDNGDYLCISPDFSLISPKFAVKSPPFFGSGDIGQSTSAWEIIPAKDGKIRIKSSGTGKFIRCDSKSMWADSDDTTADNVDTLFRPVRIDGNKIALISLSNNKFCQRLITNGDNNALAPVATSATKQTHITVEEAVLTRQIYDVQYNLDNARVYGHQVLVLAQNSATNFTNQPSNMEVKLDYKDTKTSSWKTDFSLTLGMKTSINFGVPQIFKGSVEMSAEVHSGVEWGKVFESSTDPEVVHKVNVPDMSKVTVSLLAIKGMCDVPFTYMQKDTLFDGSSVLSEVHGGTFCGSNYNSMRFETKTKKIPPASKIGRFRRWEEVVSPWTIDIRSKSGVGGGFVGDSKDTSTHNVTTLFRHVKVDNQNIDLINLGDNNLCKRPTEDGYGSALTAWSLLLPAKPNSRWRRCLDKRIYDVKYDLDNYKAYGQQVLVDKNSTINKSSSVT